MPLSLLQHSRLGLYLRPRGYSHLEPFLRLAGRSQVYKVRSRLTPSMHRRMQSQGLQHSRRGGPVFAQSPPGAVGNFSGRWTSSLQALSGVADIPQEFVFIQDSKTLTGTARVDSAQQYPMIHGLVAGDSVKFEVNNGPKIFLYDLRVEDEKLRGTLVIRNGNEMRTAKVWLERVH
jgi:hypothetical protein